MQRARTYWLPTVTALFTQPLTDRLMNEILAHYLASRGAVMTQHYWQTDTVVAFQMGNWNQARLRDIIRQGVEYVRRRRMEILNEDADPTSLAEVE